MMLLERALRRGKRLVRDVNDIRLRGQLQGRPRAARGARSIDNLEALSALLVVAHPDDEVIAAGALLSRLPRAGVICATNGAAREEFHSRSAGFDNWLDYARARRSEAEAALALCGRDFAPLENLGIVDQQATFNLVPLARYLVAPLKSGFSYVITHAYEGGHPDHDAVAFSVHAACALIERAGASPPAIVEAAFYTAPFEEHVSREFLPHGDAGPAICLELSPAEQERKLRMFDLFATQRRVLRHFGVERESFRLAPRYHFSAPPHAGAIGFDQFKWPLTGKVWRRIAWRAMRELDMLEELA